MARLERFFPKSDGKPRIDDRRAPIFIIIINIKWLLWIRIGLFTLMMHGIARAAADVKTIMNDAAYLKTHRKAFSLRLKRGGVVD